MKNQTDRPILEMPMIRLELDHMKQTIVASLAAHSQELSEYTEREIERAIQSFDFSTHVRSWVHGAISQALKNYFSYGEGWKTIQATVTDALDKALLGKPLTEKEEP